MDRRAFALSFATLPLASAASAEDPAPLQAPNRNNHLRGASTFSHVGKELKPFVAQPEAVLAEQDGAGFLDHLWFGGDFANFTRLRLRFYVDREASPSIDMELGLGAGVGFLDPTAPWGTQWSGITGVPSGVFLNYRIPFDRHLRITAELPQGVARDTVFWWIARGCQGLPLTVSGLPLPTGTRLRLHKLEKAHMEPLQEFDLCRVPGAGMLFQVTMAAQSTNLEFMEGQMRAYMGTDKEPQMLSSGLEDYFLGTYYFNRGLYHLPQAGLTHKDEANASFSGYRFHDIDPLFFQHGLRLACRCGETLADGKTAGPTGKPMATTYTTYAWTYEW